MIDRICVVLEGLSIAVCLHRLYGKKFRFDIATVSLITIEMIMMQAIDYFHLSSELSAWFTPIIWIYCIIEFGFNIRELVINNILNSIIICILQVIMMMIFYMFDRRQIIVGMRPLITNSIILIIVFVLPQLKKGYLVNLIKDKDKILIIALIIGVSIIFFWLAHFKEINFINHLDFLQYILFAICIIMIGFLVLKMGKYKVKSKEIETELKMHMLYADTFDNLIDNIRERQHEFDNHINTIYSQHYIYSTYEELVEAQKTYCNIITKENKFNKILISGNRVIIGFLYGKFNEIDKLGIKLSYHINIGELQMEMPIYKMVEILGNLIGNAVEALISMKKYNELYVSIVEEKKGVYIEVRNKSDFINYTEIELFFTKGFSKKGERRGLGLFHVKKICDEYNLSISCQNTEINEENWISFTISDKKETTQ